MAKKSGWWDLSVNVELEDVDREHIAELIKQGYTSGSIEGED